jgi:hypothetical protein
VAENESAGFDQCQALVKRQAKTKGSDAGRDAIEQIKNHTRRLNQILDGPIVMPIREQKIDLCGNVVADWDVEPRRIFEDFINGVYFHEDEDRRERIGEWLPSELQRCVFINTVHAVSHVYRSLSTIVEGILGQPRLRA